MTFVSEEVHQEVPILQTLIDVAEKPPLVPVRRLPSPSRSIHFGDVSEANGRESVISVSLWLCLLGANKVEGTLRPPVWFFTILSSFIMAKGV